MEKDPPSIPYDSPIFNFLYFTKIYEIMKDKCDEFLVPLLEHWQNKCSTGKSKSSILLSEIEGHAQNKWLEIEDFLKNIGKEELKGDKYYGILQEMLQNTILSPVTSPKKAPKKQVKIYMEGCFDLMHSGHFNAIRQAKQLGDILVVGVISDAEITVNKGPPIMNEIERTRMARACKWVDEVLEGVPYDPTVNFLDSHGLDYNAHGDDLVVSADGVNAAQVLAKAGRMRVFKRTEGVSTTDIVGRLLLMTRVGHSQHDINLKQLKGISSKEYIQSVQDPAETAHIKKTAKFLATARRLRQFANNKEPLPTDKVVYLDGSFDLFHAGHIAVLEQAKSYGDFLIVGIHDDQTVNKFRGKNLPIMALHERVLSVLSCKYVDEVVMGAPWDITDDLLKSLNIQLVLEGTRRKIDESMKYYTDPYAIPKSMGIHKIVDSKSDLTAEIVIERIIKNREKLLEKHKKKQAKEEIYYKEQKEYVQEI